jgi:hypothetical protein
MRRPRCRRSKRHRRPHSKSTYQHAAVKIQRCFRRFMILRYADSCTNYNDDDCIMLQPVSHIPREVLLVVDKIGFDARHLLAWMARSSANPLTREPLEHDVRRLCLDKAVTFLRSEQRRISNRKGYFSRKRILKRTIERHVDLEKCKRRRTRFA